MINNFESLSPLLQFDNPGDCYFVQILKRRKDNPTMERDMEVIDNFFFYSIEDAEKKMPRIIHKCNCENARAYLRVNRRNTEKLALMTAQKILGYIISRDFKAAKNAYLSAAGENHSEPKKRWIIDIDFNEQFPPVIGRTNPYGELDRFIHNLQPLGNKHLAFIPTKNGVHFICTPFNVLEFRKVYPNIDIHKDNPTILYIP